MDFYNPVPGLLNFGSMEQAIALWVFASDHLLGLNFKSSCLYFPLVFFIYDFHKVHRFLYKFWCLWIWQSLFSFFCSSYYMGFPLEENEPSFNELNTFGKLAAERLLLFQIFSYKRIFVTGRSTWYILITLRLQINAIEACGSQVTISGWITCSEVSSHHMYSPLQSMK